MEFTFSSIQELASVIWTAENDDSTLLYTHHNISLNLRSGHVCYNHNENIALEH